MNRNLILTFLFILQTLSGSCWELLSKHIEASAIPGHHIIWSSIQDNKGRMWFASNAGMLRYDGNNWVLYPTPNPVRSFVIQASGNIYVA